MSEKTATIIKKPRLQERYEKQVVPAMIKEFGLKNALAVPRVQKVVVNMGIKEGAVDIKLIDQAREELTMIAGQRPVITRAKKSISNFKLREGAPIGLMVTLRKRRMYEFMDRFFNVAMPRIKDFHGFSLRSFDANGNYTLGLQEQIIFPEIEYDQVKKVQGMDITFVISGGEKEQSKRLLELLGFPFRK
ncbi:MAG: 50S ribosomal protein L5 [Candidatus Omnitrophica bacterium]|nr:50S ribosomal protein L5 [Candidatus Omnitrophota bacterium]